MPGLQILRHFLVEKGLANCPAQIWNCDETEFDLQGRAGNVIGSSSRKQASYRVLSGSRGHITMLPCFNACGQWMPPYFILPGKRVPVTFNPLEEDVKGSVFSMTETGYVDTHDGNRICGYADILHMVCQSFHPKPSTSETRCTPY